MRTPPSETSRIVVGVDVGGTRLSAALVAEDGAVPSLRRAATPREAGGAVVLAALADVIAECISESTHQPAAIGVGFGGPVDYERQAVRMSHHVEGWTGQDVVGTLGERFGLPIYLENDANAGGLGEAWFGAGRGARDMLYVNIGTGVGGALILDGQVRHGANSNAGEFGHVVIVPDGPVCTCGKRGCVEVLCSGDAIGRMGRERRNASPGLRALPEAEITGRTVADLALQGDEACVGIFADSAEHMGFAVAAAVNLIDPGVVVLGGGVPEIGETYLTPVREAFARYAMDVPTAGTRIVQAALGYNAGVVGAATVAFQRLGAFEGRRA